MRTITCVDKTGWPDGPWMQEPDRAEWFYRGVACLVKRNRVSGMVRVRTAPVGPSGVHEGA